VAAGLIYPLFIRSASVIGPEYAFAMTDEEHSDPDDQTPDHSASEHTAESQSPEAGDTRPGFRIASHLPSPVDFSSVFRLQALAEQLREQFSQIQVFKEQNLNLLRGIEERLRLPVPVAPVWNVPTPVLPNLQQDLAEQLQQLARISVPVPQYDFGLDLGRILNERTTTWLASMRAFAERLEELIPDNLRDLSVDDLEKVFRVNVEDGTSLAWAPRAAIVEEILQAPDIEARGDILVAHAADIAADVEESLARILVPEHAQLRSMLQEAAGALRARLYSPAQAAACLAFDTIMNVHMLNFLAYSGKKNRDQTRSHFRPVDVDDWDELSFAELELVLVGAGIATAFEHWHAGSGPASFNRHGSVHHVDDGSYSPAHAVRALLIAQATLRWLDAAVAQESQGEDAA